MGTGLLVSYVCYAHRYGGAEEQLHHVAKHLANLGEELTLATMACPHPAEHVDCPTSQELQDFEATCGYSVNRIPGMAYGTG